MIHTVCFYIYIYIYIYILAFEYNTGTADITHNTCTQLHMTNRPRGLRFCVALGLASPWAAPMYTAVEQDCSVYVYAIVLYAICVHLCS